MKNGLHSGGVTLCIINHNGERYLRRTLTAAIEDKSSFSELLLIDNASTDRGLEIVREDFPGVRILELDENRGPGRARNAGLEAASTDRVMFIDNDVIPEPGCARLLCQALDDHPRAVFAMPSIVHDSNPSIVQFCGANCHFIGLQSLEHAEQPVSSLDNRVQEVDSLVTACVVFDRARWPGGKLFDEDFFLYFEDHEVGLRSRLLGCSIIAVPQAQCRHREGTIGVSIRQTGSYSHIRIRNTIRNRWQLILKHYQIRTLLILSPALLAFELFQAAGALRRGWVGHWAAAFRWVAGQLPVIYRRRRALKQSRRRGDGMVLQGGPLPFNPALISGGIERSARRLLDSLCGLNWLLVRPLLSTKDDSEPR